MYSLKTSILSRSVQQVCTANCVCEVCSKSVPQLCHKLCARKKKILIMANIPQTVYQKCAARLCHQVAADCVPELCIKCVPQLCHCGRKTFAYGKCTCGKCTTVANVLQLVAENLPQLCGKFTATMHVPQGLYFGKG